MLAVVAIGVGCSLDRRSGPISGVDEDAIAVVPVDGVDVDSRASGVEAGGDGSTAATGSTESGESEAPAADDGGPAGGMAAEVPAPAMSNGSAGEAEPGDRTGNGASEDEAQQPQSAGMTASGDPADRAPPVSDADGAGGAGFDMVTGVPMVDGSDTPADGVGAMDVDGEDGGDDEDTQAAIVAWLEQLARLDPQLRRQLALQRLSQAVLSGPTLDGMIEALDALDDIGCQRAGEACGLVCQWVRNNCDVCEADDVCLSRLREVCFLGCGARW